MSGISWIVVWWLCSANGGCIPQTQIDVPNMTVCRVTADTLRAQGAGKQPIIPDGNSLFASAACTTGAK